MPQTTHHSGQRKGIIEGFFHYHVFRPDVSYYNERETGWMGASVNTGIRFILYMLKGEKEDIEEGEKKGRKGEREEESQKYL